MKHMKKSMFLTTIIMVAVLVVALSTATFAWYTSNTSVNTTETTLGSAKSSSANLQWTWKSGSTILYSGTQIAFSGLDVEHGLQPMIPTAELTNESTTVNFIGAPVDASNTQFKSADQPQSPWTQHYDSIAADTVYELTTKTPDNWTTNYTDYYRLIDGKYVKEPYQGDVPTWAANTFYSLTSGTVDPYNIDKGVTVSDLYLTNDSNGDSGALSLSIEVESDSANLASALRVAVFENSKFVGVLANGTTAITYATDSEGWNADAAIDESVTKSGWNANNSVNIASIAGGADSKIGLYAWFDGQYLTGALAGKTVSFTLQVGLA